MIERTVRKMERCVKIIQNFRRIRRARREAQRRGARAKTIHPVRCPLHRLTAVAVSLSLLLSLLPTAALAAENSLCEHHPVHTVECGYKEAVQGHPCEHEHTADCYTDEPVCGYDEAAETTVSGSDAGHTHDQGCYALDCPHERGEHDGSCGYIEAVEGCPCGYVCGLCVKINQDQYSGAEESVSGNSLPAPGESVSGNSLPAPGESVSGNSLPTPGESVSGNSLPAPGESVSGNALPAPEGAEVITIMAFDGLTGAVQYQSVPAGTKLDGLLLPETLGASGCRMYDEEPALEPEAVTVEGVSWEPDSLWDEAAEQGSYIFTPVLPEGYTLAEGVEMPEIYMMVGARPMLTSTSEYDSGDVAAINAMIDNNGLSAAKDDPAGWETAGIVDWNNASLKRIGTLNVTEQNLTGKLDVSKLTYLYSLYCENNQLTDLIGLKNLPNLFQLRCSDNKLSTLDVSVATGLKELSCARNQLTSVNVSGLTKLHTFYCNANKLSTLDVSGLINLGSLYCQSNSLTSLDLSNLPKLGWLFCGDNQLNTLDLSGLKQLSKASILGNPLILLKLSDTAQLTMNGSANGTVELTGYTHSSKSATVTATPTPGSDYIFKEWSATGISLPAPTENPVKFTVDSMIAITPVFEDQNAAAVSAAKSAIEGGTYKVAQAGSGSEESLKTALAGQINALPGMIGAGIMVSVSDITVSSFTAAAAGDADDPDGTDGSFSFTVNLSKGLASAATESRNGTITATAFIGQSNAAAVSAAKSAIEGGTYKVAQADAESEEALKTALAGQINALPGMIGAGIMVTTSDITVSSFTAAAAGDADDPDGTDGSFSFTVNLSKGLSSATTDSRNGVIVPTMTTSFYITFHPDGGTVLPATMKTDDNGRLPSLPVPVKSGVRFDGWYLPDGTAVTLNTVFTAAVMVTARWTSEGDSGSDSDSNGASGAKPSVTPQPEGQTEGKNDVPTMAETDLNAQGDGKGGSEVTVSEGALDFAIRKARDEAERNGSSDNGIALRVNVAAADGNINSLTVNLPKVTQEQIISNQVETFALVMERPDIILSLSLASVQEINRQANADVQITATRLKDTSVLSEEARSAVGGRPVFKITATSHDGARYITNFGSASVNVDIPYKQQSGESAGGLYLVYLDEQGKTHFLSNSGYDKEKQIIRGSTNHLSLYAVGYKPPVSFSDVQGHWAGEDIEFVASRGLMDGAGAEQFSPDSSLTRAMFVTALGRLAGIDPDGYQPGSFTDVPGGSDYASYAEWAAQTGIFQGDGNGKFSPDSMVTRQQMAAIMANYTRAMGYKLPAVRESLTFTDDADIAVWAADAVRAMQRSGIMMGKDGGCFDPEGPATRAQASAALHRYIKLMIDWQTTQGWSKNDSGTWMYYQNGKYITGDKVINGVSYRFDGQGQLTKAEAVSKASGTGETDGTVCKK